jgi:putative effector of murein hydrolase
MFKRSTCLLLVALAAAVVPAVSRSNTFAPQSSISRRSDVVANAVLPSKDANLSDIPFVTTVNGGAMSVQDKAVAGASALFVFDTIVRKTFRAQGIDFPAQLGGCIILFGFMLISEMVAPGVGDGLFKALSPGAALLTKWLPVFFVPGLAMLPLAPSIGTAVDVRLVYHIPISDLCSSDACPSLLTFLFFLQHILVLSVVILGFFYSSSTVAFTVLAMRKSAGKLAVVAPVKKGRAPRAAAKVVAPAAPAKPFLDSTLTMLVKGSVITGIASILATRKGYEYATTVRTVFHFIATVATYVWASLLPIGFTKFVHPLVVSTILTWGLMQFTAVATGDTFKTVLKTYKSGSLNWVDSGAGDHLLNLLGPSVISFAIAMYSRKKLLKENFSVVVVAMLISAGGGLFGTAAFVRAINLGGKNGGLVRLSVLSRNVTTALAMAVTSILEGNISIAASVVVLTGIFAATFGRSILTSMGIHDPVARGLGIGAAGQGLGVASMSPEPDAFPFAAMSMVLTAMCATTLVSIPAVKDVLVKLATGV